MWHLQSEQFKQACEVIDKLVGQAPEWTTSQMVHCQHTLPRNPPVQFPHTLSGFGAALSAGWSWDFALPAFAALSHGWFDSKGLTFGQQQATAHCWNPAWNLEDMQSFKLGR